LMPQSRILKAGDQVPITPIDQPPFVDSRPDSPAAPVLQTPYHWPP
jgi:hypothetical protein